MLFLLDYIAETEFLNSRLFARARARSLWNRFVVLYGISISEGLFSIKQITNWLATKVFCHGAM